MPADKRKGLIQVFTGEGKGKTSAAMGVVLRALGHDFKVRIVHFMKGNFPYGEQKALASFPNVTISTFGRTDFVDPNNVRQEDREAAQRALEAARESLRGGGYDLVVLDEINVACAWGLVGIDQVEELIKEKPDSVELILTGRYADPRIIQLADLVTEMLSIKHPFREGVEARAGIDY